MADKKDNSVAQPPVEVGFEEDDLFEEFAAQGALPVLPIC